MKLGYVTWGCGLACLILSVVATIAGIVTGGLHLVGKGIGGTIFGFVWLHIGTKQIQKAKLEEIQKMLEEARHRFQPDTARHNQTH